MVNELKAKNILLAVLTFLVCTDILITILAKDYGSGVIRISLTLVLFYFLVAGYKWAKWLSILLVSAAALLCIYFGIKYILIGLMRLVGLVFIIGIVLLLIGFGLAMFALFIGKNNNINAYFKTRREQRAL